MSDTDSSGDALPSSSSPRAGGGGGGSGSGDGTPTYGASIPPVSEPTIVEMCEAMGLTPATLTKSPHTIKEVSVFQAPRFSMAGLATLTELEEVTLVQAPLIGRIEGLDMCRRLTRLFILECNLMSLRGLEACTNLRVLCVDGNKISSLAGVEGLLHLEQLWVNDNRLPSMDGLQTLTALTDLSLARNRIERIGTYLDHNTSLTQLNLSDNRVGYFKEIVNLTRLPLLTSVAFNDPHFGPNPVCNLCNYQTYVLYQLTQVTTLDSLIISDDAKHLAEATFMKKKMYYNMRIKTLKRNTTNVVRRAQETMQARLSSINVALNSLRRHCKTIVREVEERELQLGPSMTEDDKHMVSELRSIQEQLRAAMDSKKQQIVDIQARFHALKLRLMAVSEQNISRMIVELSTGGNIRLEDGKPGDVWYSSCVDLVHSRFYGRDFASVGIRGVKVHRVTRIHNRFLRNRFDKRVSNLLATNPALAAKIASKGAEDSGRPGRRTLEYLFYALPWPWGAGSSPAVHAGQELRRVAEEGFVDTHRTARAPIPPLPDGYTAAALRPSFSSKSRRFGKKKKASDGSSPSTPTDSYGIPLTNSLSVAEMPRVCEGLARVLETSGLWKRSSTASRDSSSPDADIDITSPCSPDRWLGKAGIDASTARTRSAMDMLQAGVYDTIRSSSSARQTASGGSSSLDSEPPAAGLTRTEVGEGLILISKVFLGNCLNLADTEEGKKTEGSDVDDVQYHSVVMPREDDPKQRQWVVLDEALALPEYAVEVEFEWESAAGAGTNGTQEPISGRVRDKEGVTSGTMAEELAALAELTSGAGAPAAGSAPPAAGGAAADGGSGEGSNVIRLAPQEEADLRPLVRPLARFTNECRSAIPADAAKVEDELSDCVKRIEGVLPGLTSREPASELTPTLIESASHGIELSKLKYLNLHGNRIAKIQGLSSAIALETLVLSFNEITKVEGLSGLINLKRLELDHNQIALLEPACFSGMRGLCTLELGDNQLSRIDDLTVLQACLPGLQSLSLEGCPIASSKSYVQLTLAKLPCLTLLDGKPVGDAERQRAARASTTISLAMIKTAGQSGTGGRVWPHFNITSEPGVDGTDSSSGLAGAGGSSKSPASDDARWEEVEILDLSHRWIRKLSNLGRLAQLRVANFSDNEITRIEGLESLVLLEELSLEENRISCLEGLENLKFLKKLDLGKNQLTKLENLEGLTNLSQLSVEDNMITSLDGLSGLRNLMELYIGNNRIESVKEHRHIKELSKLIILDLSGNPLCSAENYRLYTVYHLRRLKVLDGVGVDADEQAAAKDRYSGRLTMELLEEKIGHSYFEAIRELDLASCRIREIEALNATTFRCLSFLNLDHNNLTGSGILGLRDLPHLSVLRLNHNRVSSLIPTFEESSPRVASSSAMPLPSSRYFAQLEVLQLGFNRITDISQLCLDRLPELKVLYLHGNEISRVSGLSSCGSLRELVLDKNKIKFTDSSSFVGLSELRELRIQENGLRSLSHFSSLVSVQVLAMGYNRISDIGELDKLAALPYLTELWLVSNPVARKQLYRPALLRKLPALASLDGREVTEEERERAESLFAGEQRPVPIYHQDPRVASGGRVALQLTSVSFDTLTGNAVMESPHPSVAHSSGPSSASAGGLPYSLPVASIGMPSDGGLGVAGTSEGIRAVRRSSGGRGSAAPGIPTSSSYRGRVRGADRRLVKGRLSGDGAATSAASSSRSRVAGARPSPRFSGRR